MFFPIQLTVLIGDILLSFSWFYRKDLFYLAMFVSFVLAGFTPGPIVQSLFLIALTAAGLLRVTYTEYFIQTPRTSAPHEAFVFSTVSLQPRNGNILVLLALNIYIYMIVLVTLILS